MRRRSIPLVLAVIVALSGCTSSAPTPVAAAQLVPGVAMGPEGTAFYTAPPVPAGARPGDLIWARPLPAPAPGLAGVAILYWSTAVSGGLVAVSGVLVQRAGGQPDPPRAIVAWAHGTSGLGDQCAPSQEYFRGSGGSVPIAQLLVNAGAIFVASDYEGLGPPGDHPYMVSRASGRNVLDSIRAATQFSAAGAGAAPLPPAVILGVSQGGAAALFAAEMHSAYASELRVLSAVAVSAPSSLDTLASSLSEGRYFGYVLMLIYGFRVAYPELEPQVRALTAEGRAALGRVSTQCSDEILSDYAGRSERQFGTGPALRWPDFSLLLAANDPGRSGSDVPVLLVHGQDDDIVPVRYNRDLLRRYCATGTTVSQSVYSGRGHVDVLSAALPEIVSYWRDRLAGTPASSQCATATP